MSTVVIKSRIPAEVRFDTTAEASDEQLLIRYRDTRDQQVFALLVGRFERELYSYLRRYLGNAEMAEDAFQATFLQLHLKCDQYEEGRKLRPWLYMIATNKAIDLQRRSRRFRSVSLNGSQSNDGDESVKLVDTLVSDEPTPLANVDNAEQGAKVDKSLQGLPEHLRLVVNLVYFQGMKYREAAEVLSIPVGTVKSRMHAAILKMTDDWDTESK